jgi:hypothetical protein
MTASSAIAAKGVTLTRDGNAIAEISKIGGMAVNLETADVTTLGSADYYREYIGTLFSVEDMELEGNFIAGDTNGQAGLLADMAAITLQTFVLTFPTTITATWTFTAYVTKFVTGPFETAGKVDFSATLKISGKPTLAITASTGLTTPFFSISESAVIVPAAAGAVYDYVATVVTAKTSVTITPTATAGVIKVNGNTVATGVASSAITLGAAGSVTTATVTVTETGKTAKTYTIRIVRAAS